MAVLVIPARYGSRRLPGKPLLAETGKPLILHVLERARAASSVTRVIVATDDVRIRAAVESAGAEVFMTSPDHRCGTERVAEVARALPDEEQFVNLQGDEPETDPTDVDILVRTLAQDEVSIATLAAPIRSEEELDDPTVVKVVVSAGGDALYFSRAPIPFSRDGDRHTPLLRHLGIYGFRRDALLTYARLPASGLERTEKLEQLRALEAGMRIRVATVAQAPPGIDTMETYRAFVRRHAARSGEHERQG